MISKSRTAFRVVADPSVSVQRRMDPWLDSHAWRLIGSTPSANAAAATKQPMIYISGGTCAAYNTYDVCRDFPSSDCHCENKIRPKDPIRCRECGYRIMYKKRTKRSTQHVYLSRAHSLMHTISRDGPPCDDRGRLL